MIFIRTKWRKNAILNDYLAFRMLYFCHSKLISTRILGQDLFLSVSF